MHIERQQVVGHRRRVAGELDDSVLERHRNTITGDAVFRPLFPDDVPVFATGLDGTGGHFEPFVDERHLLLLAVFLWAERKLLRCRLSGEGGFDGKGHQDFFYECT